MEKQQLIKLIDNKGTSSKEETTELWDIVRMFPYFQTARLLLVKSFHKQGSIHFHNELKTAAAYASDRKVLYHLILDDGKKQSAVEENNVFVIEEKQPATEVPVLKLNDVGSENQFALLSESETYIDETPSFEETKTDVVVLESKYQKDEIAEEKTIPSKPLASSSDDISTTQEEIIRRRLNEILSRNKPEEKKSEPLVDPALMGQAEKNELPASIESVTAKEETEQTTLSVLDKLPATPSDEIEGLEIETIIEENYLQELEKLPVINEPVERIEEEANKPESKQADSNELSFIDWLKQKSSNKTTVEEVKDEPFNQAAETISARQVTQSTELIKKFIETTPRITPVKTEFYSPANMAKQSLIDNEEIISETLADIYFKQENYEKARSYYERLSLLYPEKSGFFAPLIQKIDTILKNQT